MSLFRAWLLASESGSVFPESDVSTSLLVPQSLADVLEQSVILLEACVSFENTTLSIVAPV